MGDKAHKWGKVFEIVLQFQNMHGYMELLHFQEKKLNYFVKTVIAVVTTIEQAVKPRQTKKIADIGPLPFYKVFKNIINT